MQRTCHYLRRISRTVRSFHIGLIPSALPLLLVVGISSIFLAGPLPWILGGLAAFPVFVIVVITPFFAVGGLVEEHRSSLWTLA